MSAAPDALIEVTEADLRRFAPKARREYISAILGKLSVMRQAGMLESPHRWCHFMGQAGHETDGLTIIRESLIYTSAARLREVWPARFRNKMDDELAHLLRDPVALGDAVYMGRMGNALPGQGYAYRGAGLLQSTGVVAATKYAKSLGLDVSPALLDDVMVTTDFAILEWQQSGCNAWADENDIMKVSRAINVGSAVSGVMPVEIEGRRKWFARAWAVWGDEGKPDVPAKKMTTGDKVKFGGLVVAGAETGRQVVEVVKSGIPAVPSVATDSLQNFSAWKTFAKTFSEAGKDVFWVFGVAGKMWPLLAVAGVAGAGYAYIKLVPRRNGGAGNVEAG